MTTKLSTIVHLDDETVDEAQANILSDASVSIWLGPSVTLTAESAEQAVEVLVSLAAKMQASILRSGPQARRQLAVVPVRGGAA
jgi:hypothetical protein